MGEDKLSAKTAWPDIFAELPAQALERVLLSVLLPVEAAESRWKAAAAEQRQQRRGRTHATRHALLCNPLPPLPESN